MSPNQEAFIPQVVAIGPYHCQRPELFEMERYKLTSAKRVQKYFKPQIKFANLVKTFKQNDTLIRASYHRFLDLKKETLAWRFAIDASFLFEYLQTYSAKKEGSLTRISSKMSHLIDYTGRKTAHQAILRDIIMLENQIPLFLLTEIHEIYNYNNEFSDPIFSSMLLGFCKDLSPLKEAITDQYVKETCLAKAHLLDLLYSAIVPKEGLTMDHNNIENEQPHDKENVKTASKMFWYIISVPILVLKTIFNSKIVMFILTLPYKVFLHFSNDKNSDAMKQLLSTTEDVVQGMEDIFQPKEESPLVEELSIPSVSELFEIGVKFCPAKGGLETICFDKILGKFYIPVINLDDNSEVVLRNLVAYEASVAPEVMVFSRYTELMNGIIDKEEDVRILRECGIVLNRLKSDKEVANLFNGMTKSVKITKVSIVDKAIEDANGYYSASWTVKKKGIVNKYLFGSWPILVFVAANLLLLFSAVEAGCSVFDCSKWFGSSK
ncbi:hypothetical protein UlMin_035950 [Ulmus minor]